MAVNLLRRISLFFLIWNIGLLAIRAESSKNNEELTHHLILAVNWAPVPASWAFDHATSEAIKELSQFVVRDGQGKIRQVLAENDFYSCLAFRADVDKNTLKQYIQPVCDKEGRLLIYTENYADKFVSNVVTKWSELLKERPFKNAFQQSFSLLTVAKPFCLNYFSNVDNKQFVNRTFLILVSDHIFNGDMYQEIINLRQFNQNNSVTGIRDDDVFPICYNVNQSYFIRHLKTKEIRHKSESWSNPQGYVELFEYVPLQKNFQLASVIDYPVLVKAKRIRGSKFRCDLPLANRHHASYKPLLLNVLVGNKPFKSWNQSELETDIEFTFDVDDDEKRPSQVQLQSWVQVLDGVYNATVLSPSPKATEESGRRGLNVKLQIEYEKKASIFIIPMPDFLWLSCFPDDQYVAASLWEFIMILIVVAGVIFSVVRLYVKHQYFTPSVEELKFKIERKN